MKPILHITSKPAWDAARQNGFYSAPSLETEGFIHCSMPAQVVGVAERYYANERGLILLVLDSERIRPEIRYEAGTDKPDELFPHIYGPINLEAVTRVVDFVPDYSGNWILHSL